MVLTKWRIHDLFYRSLLEQNITRKERIEKILELDTSNDDNKKYKVKVIWDNTVYAIKLELVYLLGFYYWIA